MADKEFMDMADKEFDDLRNSTISRRDFLRSAKAFCRRTPVARRERTLTHSKKRVAKDSNHGKILLNSAGKSSVKDFYLGCFAATTSGRLTRAGTVRIASPSTKHHEYWSPLVDNRAVDEARKTGLNINFSVGTHTG